MRRTKDYASRAGNQGEQKLRNLCNMADDLSLLEQIKLEILPKIQKDLAQGISAEEILKKYQAYAAGRLVTNMVMDTDSGKSTAAAKEVLDRTMGKAVERRETTHRYEELSDQELDALVASKTGK